MATILVVDADHGERTRTMFFLSRMGHEAIEAPSLYDAVAAARRRHPELVVLSLGSRPADAIQLGKDLLALDPTTSIVLITEVVDRVLIAAADAMQAAGIVRQGAGPERLQAVVERSLRLTSAKRRKAASERPKPVRVWDASVAPDSSPPPSGA